MYYINPQPTATGSYGNPASPEWKGSVALPDELLGAYIEAKGFVHLTVEDGVVTALETNQEALEAYLAEHPETAELAEEVLTPEERLDAVENAIERGLSL